MWLVGLLAFMMAIALIAVCTLWLFRLHKTYYNLSESPLIVRKIDFQPVTCRVNWNWAKHKSGSTGDTQNPAFSGEDLFFSPEEGIEVKQIPALAEMLSTHEHDGLTQMAGPAYKLISQNKVAIQEQSEVVITPDDLIEAEDDSLAILSEKRSSGVGEGTETSRVSMENMSNSMDYDSAEYARSDCLPGLTSKDYDPTESKGGIILMDPLIRAEVVIGEATKQLLVENNFTLSQPAIKIRNITAELRNLTTELIIDKVIIQGILHKQIFFVGEDNIVHHQSEDVPFSTFLDIFGAEPGMNVQVHPTIETVLFNLLTPTLLHQKVVIEFFVKVTESTQLNILEGAGPLVRIDQVIGEGTKQELLENTVTLNVPAVKIDDITAEIRDLTIEVIEDKVIIQGILHKQIFFIGEDNIEYHQAVDMEFSTFIDIVGAEPGMDVVVEPTIEFIHFELLDAVTEIEKVVIEFFVKVTESVQLNVALGPGALLKLDTVVGEQTKQILVENTVTLSQPAIKVREIVARVENLMAEVIEDKVIIQGIIHKQIFFINENNLEIHQSENVPFSTFVDIPGAVQGMDIRIKPVIETILFELMDSTTLRQKVIVELFVKVTESQQLEVQIAAPYGPYYF